MTKGKHTGSDNTIVAGIVDAIGTDFLLEVILDNMDTEDRRDLIVELRPTRPGEDDVQYYLDKLKAEFRHKGQEGEDTRDDILKCIWELADLHR